MIYNDKYGRPLTKSQAMADCLRRQQEDMKKYGHLGFGTKQSIYREYAAERQKIMKEYGKKDPWDF